MGLVCYWCIKLLERKWCDVVQVTCDCPQQSWWVLIVSPPPHCHLLVSYLTDLFIVIIIRGLLCSVEFSFDIYLGLFNIFILEIFRVFLFIGSVIVVENGSRLKTFKSKVKFKSFLNLIFIKVKVFCIKLSFRHSRGVYTVLSIISFIIQIECCGNRWQIYIFSNDYVR